MSLDIYLEKKETVFEANITHNLNTMAKEAGLYKALWRPEELEIYNAEELILILENGLKELKSKPANYRRLNPVNGWGTYDGLVELVEDYLKACKKHPEAFIRTHK